jgi:hypothetical protein
MKQRSFDKPYPLGVSNCRDCSRIRRDDRALVLLRALNGEPPEIGAPVRLYGHGVAPIVLIGLGILIIYQAGSF